MRKRRSARERERLFNLHNGRCHICSMPIHPGEAFELEHVVPYELTRDESDENVQPAHLACHKTKTADDVRGIRKADRMRQKHLGLALSKMPMSNGRHSKWKRKLDGTVVLRVERRS